VTCREFADFIADYLSGELPADTRAHFDRHIGLCRNCEQYLSHYKTTVALGKRAFQDDAAEVPADVPEELVKAILSSRSKL
jgi:anti-sigma factor RsiW